MRNFKLKLTVLSGAPLRPIIAAPGQHPKPDLNGVPATGVQAHLCMGLDSSARLDPMPAFDIVPRSGTVFPMAARRLLFVHIGPPKTASSTIQRMLRSLAPWLAEQGLLVPLAGRRRAGGHCQHLVYSQVESHSKHRAWRGGDPWRALAEEIGGSSASRVVISAEAFLGYRAAMDWPARIAAFAEAVDADVRIIAYVRPQYQMLESTYDQRTRYCQNLQPFEVFKAEFLASGELDWCTRFEPWRKTFGSASLTVTPMDRSRLGEDIRSHFLRQLGEGDPPPLDQWSRVNVRYGAKHLEVRRMVGMALQAAGRDPTEVTGLLSNGVAAVFRCDEPFAALSAEEARAVTELFAASNARFARDYGIDADGVLFREPVPDRRRRPNLASWTDFSAGERRRSRLLALDALGVDIVPQERTAVGWRRGIDRAQVWFLGRRYRFRRRFRRRLSRLRNVR